jgi:putative membrane protein
MMWRWPGMMGGHFGVGGILGLILCFLFFVVIIAAIITFIVLAAKRSKYAADYWHKMGDKSLAILKEKYAKGEITKDQYESMKKDIS